MSIDDGMVAARDICGVHGNVLITKGTILSSSLGRRLEHWGIQTVYVEGDEESQPETNAVIPSSDEIYKQLADKFSGVMDNPLMKKLFMAILTFRTTNTR